MLGGPSHSHIPASMQKKERIPLSQCPCLSGLGGNSTQTPCSWPALFSLRPKASVQACVKPCNSMFLREAGGLTGEQHSLGTGPLRAAPKPQIGGEMGPGGGARLAGGPGKNRGDSEEKLPETQGGWEDGPRARRHSDPPTGSHTLGAPTPYPSS